METEVIYGVRNSSAEITQTAWFSDRARRDQILADMRRAARAVGIPEPVVRKCLVPIRSAIGGEAEVEEG